jgi:hypothetical protein
MGIFDIFKKKKTDSTFPENELEQCLMRAANDTNAQKEFYQRLLWSPLYLLTNGHSPSEEGSQILEENTTVGFITFDDGKIPVFTSTNRMFDKGIITKAVPYVSMMGQDLFGVAIGATFILNPYSICGKELVPTEIENLLNGTIYSHLDEQEIENKKILEFNKIYERALKNQNGLILLDGDQKKPLNESEKKKLEESINDFQKCLELFPNNWQSMMLQAKYLQRLERHTQALEKMEEAMKIEPNEPSIPMEASLEALHLQDIDKAIFYSSEAIKRNPNHVSALGNHAMNLIVAEKDAEAKEVIEKALALDPNDPVNRNIKALLEDINSGKRPRLTFKDIVG